MLIVREPRGRSVKRLRSRFLLAVGLLALVSALMAGSARAARVPIPNNFSGVSIETREFSEFAAMPDFNALLDDLEVPDHRMVVRLGGQSEDETYWLTKYLDRFRRQILTGGFIATQPWLDQVAATAEQDNLEVLFGTNLTAHNPAMAAAYAKAIHATFPARNLMGYGIGNEADIYTLGGNLDPGLPFPLSAAPADWYQSFGPLAYTHTFDQYSAAIDREVPGAFLTGPDLSGSNTAWANTVTSNPDLKLLTVHRYPFNSCSTYNVPTVPAQLSDQALQGYLSQSEPLLAADEAAGKPTVISEMGDTVCGTPNVSDTYSTALWSLNYLFTAMADGFHGGWWELRPSLLNSALTPGRKGVSPIRPMFYGMTMFAHALVGQSTLTWDDSDSKPGEETPGVYMWKLQGAAHDAEEVVNETASPARANIAFAANDMQALTNTSPYATSGTELNGESVNPLTDKFVLVSPFNGTLRCEHGCSVSVPAYSAYLIR